MASKNLFEIKDIKSCVSLAKSRCETVKELMKELRYVVYKLKKIGPRIEPCETPQVIRDEGER